MRAQKKFVPARKKDKHKQFVSTPEMRRRVACYAAAGFSKSEIMRLIINPHTGNPISYQTFEQHFGPDIEMAKAIAGGQVVETLYRLAIGNPNIYDQNGNLIMAQRDPDIRAVMAWLKKTMNWGEDTGAPPIQGPLVIVKGD